MEPAHPNYKNTRVHDLRRRTLRMEMENLITKEERNEIIAKRGAANIEAAIFHLQWGKDLEISRKILYILNDPVSNIRPNISTAEVTDNATTSDLQTNGEGLFTKHFLSPEDSQVETAVIVDNWMCAEPCISRLETRSRDTKGIYCLQADQHKLVSGSRDNTIKIWDRKSLECTKLLRGHTGSVLCLQYDEKIIISGSSDTTVRIWDVKAGKSVSTLVFHKEAVLDLKFNNEILVTCSRDKTVAVWKMDSPLKIKLRWLLRGHTMDVNAVDFDEKYIVSASCDRTINVWSTINGKLVRTLYGHQKGMACMQYRDNLIASGGDDKTIRLWDIENGKCLNVLYGHGDLVRCIRFDHKRIISGCYDGQIKVWDLEAARNPRGFSTSTICFRTLQDHSNKVCCVQLDEFQIISSGLDDRIITFDFSPNQESRWKSEIKANLQSGKTKIPLRQVGKNKRRDN